MLCRCCGRDISSSPLLKLDNMPKSAQYFPKFEDLEIERGCDINVYQCPQCGMIQLSGEPVPYYREVIRATAVSSAMREFRLQQFSSWLNRYKLKNSKIIEIGCGGGEFMSMMQEVGGDVYGIEFSPRLTAQAQAHGHRVWSMAIEDEHTLIPQAPYDAFYIMSFLEHNPTPGIYLQGICNNLTDEALGIVEVPNSDIILKEGLYSEFIQDHLLYFTKDTLCRLLEWNGFEVMSCQSIWYDYVLSAEVRRRKNYNVSQFVQRRQKVQKTVDEFFDYIDNNKLVCAVWGAGHQALANLSLLNMSAHVKYVLDSADFKQGKFTPATHIPIVPPKEISQRNIQAVLVMAGSYSTEILELLRRDYPTILRAVLEPDGVKFDE